MSDSQPVIHFTLLKKMNPDDPNEIRRYACSECQQDVFNINVHAQIDHGSLLFDVDGREMLRPNELPPHPCGIGGCSYDANHNGGHSWEPGASTDQGEDPNAPEGEILVPAEDG